MPIGSREIRYAQAGQQLQAEETKAPESERMHDDPPISLMRVSTIPEDENANLEKLVRDSEAWIMKEADALRGVYDELRLNSELEDLLSQWRTLAEKAADGPLRNARDKIEGQQADGLDEHLEIRTWLEAGCKITGLKLTTYVDEHPNETRGTCDALLIALAHMPELQGKNRDACRVL
jgi:hypothetical protein